MLKKNNTFILLGLSMLVFNLFSAPPVFADAGGNGTYPAAKPVFYKKPKTLIYKTAIIKRLEPDYSKLKNSVKSTAQKDAPVNGSKVVPAKTIAISLKQITLIKSPYIVKQVIYSKLSHIQVIHKSNNIFVSVLPLKKTEPNGLIRYIYSKSPKDIYIETPQKIYMLNLVPTDIPAQTVYLSANSGLLNSIVGNNPRNYPQKNKVNPPITIIKKRTVVYTPQSSFVNINLKLIEDGFKQKIPAGFNLIAVKHKEYKYNQADITLESVTANRHYAVYTFLVKAKRNIRLAESQFLFLVQKPMAVSIVNPVLKKYETTRVIIVGADNE